jgi:hypothetical protein
LQCPISESRISVIWINLREIALEFLRWVAQSNEN